MTSSLVTSVTHLIEILSDKNSTYKDFAIQLNGGAYSRKEMSYSEEEKDFFILNCIDGTVQYLNATQLEDDAETNIGKAIKQNAFYHLTY